MPDVSAVPRLMRDAVAEFNASVQAERRVPTNGEWQVFGPDSPLDSLALVMLLAVVEQRLEGEFGQRVTLVQELMARDLTYAMSFGQLSQLVVELLSNHGGDVA